MSFTRMERLLCAVTDSNGEKLMERLHAPFPVQLATCAAYAFYHLPLTINILVCVCVPYSAPLYLFLSQNETRRRERFSVLC